jgi:predicted nucleotidyltransferase
MAPTPDAKLHESRLVSQGMLCFSKGTGTTVAIMVIAREDVLQRTKTLVLRALADHPVTVYLIGSFARDDARPSSDIDIAVDPRSALPPGTIARLREELEESTIPQSVEVVDLRDTDPEFRERVRREGVVWSDSGNG